MVFTVSEGRFSLSTRIGGTATVRGRVQPIRGVIGKLLGELKPSIPYSQTVWLAARVVASAAPELTEDWRLQPNIQGTVQLEEARARIAKVFDLSLKDTLQNQVKGAINKEVALLNQRVVQDDFVERAARDAWVELCRPIMVSDVGDEPLFFSISPQEFLQRNQKCMEAH